MRLIKVLVYTRYSALGASSRLRILNNLGGMNSNFLPVVVPLLDNEYLKLLQSEGVFLLPIRVRSILRRLWSTIFIRFFDCVLVEKEILPYFPASVELRLIGKGARVIYDFDDYINSLFRIYSLDRLIYGKASKLTIIAKHANWAITANANLSKAILEGGAKRCSLLHTIPDTDSEPCRLAHLKKVGELSLIWVGQASTSALLSAFLDKMSDFIVENNISITTLGFSRSLRIRHSQFNHMEWTIENERIALGEADVMIMPLEDSVAGRYKSSFKIINALRSGVPFIASAIGENVSLDLPSYCGVLVDSTESWRSAFRLYKNMGHITYHENATLTKEYYKLNFENPGPRVEFSGIVHDVSMH